MIHSILISFRICAFSLQLVSSCFLLCFFFLFSLLLRSALFAFHFFFSDTNIVRAIIIYGTKIFVFIVILAFLTFIIIDYFSFNLLHSSFFFIIYVCSIYVYSVYFWDGRKSFLLTWLAQLLHSTHTHTLIYIYISFFFFNLFLLIILLSYLSISILCLLFLFFSPSSVSSPLFSTFSYLACFLITILWFFCAHVIVDLHPPFLLFKNLSFILALHFLLVSFFFQFRPSTGFATSFLCFPFRVFLHLFRLSSSLTSSFAFRRLALPPPRFSLPSPSVSVCSNIATRCPITCFVFVIVFSPSYIYRRPR